MGKNPENSEQKNQSAGQPQQPSLSLLHFIPETFAPRSLPFKLPCGVLLSGKNGVTGTRDPNAVTCEACRAELGWNPLKETTDGASPSEEPGAGNGQAGKQEPAKISPPPVLHAPVSHEEKLAKELIAKVNRLERRVEDIEERQKAVEAEEEINIKGFESTVIKYRQDTVELLRGIADSLKDIALAQLSIAKS